MNSVSNDMYHDHPTSPSRRAASYGTQSLNRQGSRGFDYGQQNGMYGVDETSGGYEDQRFNENRMPAMQPNFNTFGGPTSAGWNNTTFGQNNNLAALGATGRRPGRGGRPSLPQGWMGHEQPYGYPQPSPFGGLPPIRGDDMSDEDLIPTAIVIKNIPFAVRKENLTQIMSDMGLPLPYAFNYHFDNGVFRGLAFANFTTPEETQAVIQGMNNFNLDGRKLRVEYKKMLPQAERDRIEREKRERRGQLEEQHRPVNSSQLQPSSSLSSMVSGIQARTPSPGSGAMAAEVDMNDSQTMGWFGELVLFQNDQQRDFMDFEPMPPETRRTLHSLAEHMALEHHSEGQGEARHVRVSRKGPRPPPAYGVRSLHRSATTDFGQARNDHVYGSARHAQSSYLGMPEPLSGSARLDAQLRGAKSHADLRSYTPSPAQSSSSFPANAGNSGPRYDYPYVHSSPSSSRPNLPTPTTMSGSNEDIISNGMNNMGLGGGYGQQQQGSPQRIRTTASWDRNPGPIGGHRAFSAGLEDQNRSRNFGPAARQNRGPPGGQGMNYPRGPQRANHRNRGSDELSSPSGIDSIVD